MRVSPWWRRALGTFGIEVHTSAELAPTYDPALAAEGRYVFVYDDPATPMVGVVAWLEETFDESRKTASLIMWTVHRHGWVAIGPYPPEEVVTRLERGRRVATRLGLSRLAFEATPRSSPVA